MTNAYADLTTLKSSSYLNLSGTGDDIYLRKLLEECSRLVDKHCRRHFYAKTETRYEDGIDGKLFLSDDLLSITTLKTDEDGNAVYENPFAASDYLLYPLNGYPKRWLDLSHASGYGHFAAGVQKGVEIAGLWGYGDGESATPYAIPATTSLVWTALIDPASTGAYEYYGLCDVGGGIVLAGTQLDNDAWIVRSADYGATWAKVVKPVATEDSIKCLCHLAGTDIVLGGTDENAHIIRSPDKGLTWVDLGSIGGANHTIFNFCDMGNGKVLAVDTLEGVWYSADWGLTWTGPIVTNPGDEFTHRLAYIGNGVVLAGVGWATAKISISEDYGATWTPGSSALVAGEIQTRSVCYLGNGIVLAGTSAHGHMVRSIDGGANYTDLGRVTTDNMIHCILDAGNGIVIAGTEDSNAHILISLDWGLTWADLARKTPAGGVSTINNLVVLENGVVLGSYGGDAVGRCGIIIGTPTTGITATAVNGTTTSVTVSAADSLAVGHTILVESEQMYITAISGTTLTVRRAVNGTTGAAHSAKAVSIYQYPAPIWESVLIQAMRAWKRKDSAYVDILGNPEMGQVPVIKGLDPDVKERLKHFVYTKGTLA